MLIFILTAALVAGIIGYSTQHTHIDEKGESYFQHMSVAAKCGWLLLMGALAAFVHALLPDTFKTTATERAQEALRVGKRDDGYYDSY